MSTIYFVKPKINKKLFLYVFLDAYCQVHFSNNHFKLVNNHFKILNDKF